MSESTQSGESEQIENWNPNTMGPDCDWCGECVWCDPYVKPVGVFEGARWHMHAEPVCADPDCVTYLTREQMAEAHRRNPPGQSGAEA